MPKDFVEYPELDRVIELFPTLKEYLVCIGCCKCAANDGQKNENLTGHHLFPARHWKRNKYIILLCMKNGRNGQGRSFCHNEIEEQIRRAEESHGVVYNPRKGKRLSPIEYCRLTLEFLENSAPQQTDIKQRHYSVRKTAHYTNRPMRVQPVPTGCVSAPLSRFR
jgi:hypothetical protein